MENKWEYDYSGIYQNPYTPNNPTPPSGPLGGPDPSAPAPQSPEPPKKSGKGKKIGLSVLALVLVGAVSFGGGFAGYKLASKGKNDRVVYQAAPPSNLGTSSTSVNTGLVAVSEAVGPSVVVVTTDKVVMDNFWGGTRVVSGAGSGVIYTADGYIITNNHVIEGAQNITVKLNDGTEYTATLVGSDPQTDVAVIKIDGTGLVPAVLGDSDHVQVGEEVIAVGNPLGTLGGTVTNGIISGMNRSINIGGREMTLMQTNAAVSPGNSGGGLFNVNGELIGIVNAKSAEENTEGLGFVIPVNTARQVAQDLIENGFVTGRPMLGIKVQTIADPQTAMQFGVQSMGVYIMEVTPGSGAEAAGLKVGDRILSVGDKIVESSDDVLNALNGYAAGDEAVLRVVRGQTIITANVTLNERPSDGN